MSFLWQPDGISFYKFFQKLGLRLYAATSGYFGVKLPATVTSVDYQLPPGPPASDGQSLVSTAGAVMSWGGPFAAVAGATFSGDVQFSGAGHGGLILNSLTTTQRNSLSPSAGVLIWNSTTSRVEAYDGSAWHSHVRTDGDTMTGNLTVPVVNFGNGIGQLTYAISKALFFATSGNALGLRSNAGSTDHLTIDVSGNVTVANAFTVAGNGAASSSPLSLSGSLFTGGSGITTVPMLYLNNGSTQPTGFSTSGTYLGINAVNGFNGFFLDFRVNGGAAVFAVTNGGSVNCVGLNATTANVSGNLNPNKSQTVLNGTTSGTITWGQPLAGSALKKFIGYASSYVNNSATNQTIAFSTTFTQPPLITTNIAGLTFTATTTTLTIVSTNSATAYTGWILVEGF